MKTYRIISGILYVIIGIFWAFKLMPIDHLLAIITIIALGIVTINKGLNNA